MPSPKVTKRKGKVGGLSDVQVLWALAEHAVAVDAEAGALKATACLEAVLLVKGARLPPKTELETRLRLGDLLARSDAHETLARARAHLDRAVSPLALRLSRRSVAPSAATPPPLVALPC